MGVAKPRTMVLLDFYILSGPGLPTILVELTTRGVFYTLLG